MIKYLRMVWLELMHFLVYLHRNQSVYIIKFIRGNSLQFFILGVSLNAYFISCLHAGNLEVILLN